MLSCISPYQICFQLELDTKKRTASHATIASDLKLMHQAYDFRAKFTSDLKAVRDMCEHRATSLPSEGDHRFRYEACGFHAKIASAARLVWVAQTFRAKFASDLRNIVCNAKAASYLQPARHAEFRAKLASDLRSA